MAATASGKDKLTRHIRLYASGYDLSGDSRTFSSCDYAIGEVERGGWSEDHKHFISDDVRTLGIRGYQCIMNDTSGRSWDRLKDVSNTTIVDMAFGGGGIPAVPDPVYMLLADQVSQVGGLDDRLAILTCDFVSDSAQYTAYNYHPWGRVHHPATTQITATTNGTSVDWGAAHSNGGWATLHVIATSSGDYAFKLQHSTNDSDWSDISGATWTADGSAVTAEATTFSGSINQYTRLVATRTAGSVYIFCSVSILP